MKKFYSKRVPQSPERGCNVWDAASTATYVTLLFAQRLFEILEEDSLDAGYHVPQDAKRLGDRLLTAFRRGTHIEHDVPNLQSANTNSQVDKVC